MAEIRSFRGYRYDTTRAGELAKLIAPPYDVIDPALRDVLARMSDYNIARITRATRVEDHPSGNPYAPAAEVFRDWLARGIVRRDETPCVYVYEQYFEVHERKFSRTGLICLLRLKEWGDGVLPHEQTLTAPRQDRLELTRATRAQFGQVFGLYPDPERQIDAMLDAAKAAPPLIEAADTWGHHHRLWAISDPGAVSRIQELMACRDVLIADGHHRYETALNYMRERPDCEAAKYQMVTLVNMSNVGLVVLPIHRLVKGVAGFDRAAFLEKLRPLFRVRAYPGDGAASRQGALDAMARGKREGKHVFGLYLGNGNYYELILKHEDAMDDIPGRSEVWRRLDVVALHHLILDRLLGINEERLRAEANIKYVQDFPHALQEAADAVSRGEAQALFLLNATPVAEVQAVAERRERMPQKSTFFYPKVFTGLVFHVLE